MFKRFGLLIAVLVVLAACSSEAKTVEKQVNSANQAPSFDLIDVEGNAHSLSDYAGKKVYVKFWASWCSICLSGLEEINTLADEEKDFVVLTVVSPGFNNEKKSDSFIKWYKGLDGVSNLSVLLDEDGTIAQAFHVRGYPTSAFIASDGSLVKTQPGHMSNEQIKEQFKNIQ